MPLFKTSAEWYEQSSLLLKARPTTARITSKYTVLKPTASKISKRQKYLSKHPKPKISSTGSPPPSTSAAVQDPTEPVVTFKLKTYDPVSGACLQYQTAKAAEVGRLVGSLGRLGRCMAALPEVVEETSVAAAVDAGAGVGVAAPMVEKDVKLVAPVVEQKAGGGGKKKKKGKK
ncbi:uncharacterized protein BDR25DRAFT_328213 [Lindgomyces ingoldianus]|uniref:Uncharacterized protein n=1 Tax=Lindgomyces ingoldianus TaxID=673940 RepID=A0ACB6QID7_9PLEO|nr:uncharacterized protein BDR25DRAFT_328213 [Lindgomyces ingoldianus]KAF2466092.1 hypothetical protein BDR25DRAFT_328213 [Lindgomyces ingoldianus]